MTKPQYRGDYQRNRRLVLATSDICWMCGRPGADTVDHLIETARGGDSGLDNLAPAHRSCNARRGANYGWTRRRRRARQRW